MIVTINVTQEDIDGGCRQKGDACMVARAIQRATGHFVLVYSMIELYCEPVRQEGSRRIWDTATPDYVAARIIRFDTNQRVNPFSFDLDIPDAVLRK